MIQSGGWSRLRTQDEHSKLARVSIDLPAGADELFELNVSKTQARIPEPLRVELSAIASNVTRLAQHVYRTPVGATLATTSAGTSDVRLRAISGLVEMVVSAIEGVINGELPPAQARRVASRLREMQSGFIDELEAEIARELNGGAAADRPAARTAVATGPGRSTGVHHEQRGAGAGDGCRSDRTPVAGRGTDPIAGRASCGSVATPRSNWAFVPVHPALLEVIARRGRQSMAPCATIDTGSTMAGASNENLEQPSEFMRRTAPAQATAARRLAVTGRP